MVRASSGSHRHISQLQVQAQCEERELKAKRRIRKVQDEKEASGVGFGVEQLEFNRDLPANAAKLENTEMTTIMDLTAQMRLTLKT